MRRPEATRYSRDGPRPGPPSSTLAAPTSPPGPAQGGRSWPSTRKFSAPDKAYVSESRGPGTMERPHRKDLRLYEPALLLGTVLGSVGRTAQASRRGPRHVEAQEAETKSLHTGRAEGSGLQEHNRAWAGRSRQEVRNRERGSPWFGRIRHTIQSLTDLAWQPA